VAPTAFAINANFSRAVMCSPFQVIHAFKPRLPVTAALAGLPAAPTADDDPSSFAERLVSEAVTLYEEVRALQTRLAAAENRYFSETARHVTEFNSGDFVLLKIPRPHKLALGWRGPYVVISKDIGSIYVIRDLISKEDRRAPLSRLAPFNIGSLTDEQLRAESAAQDEYMVECVHVHRPTGAGGIELLVRWLGFPEADPDDPDSWVPLEDVRHLDVVRDYLKNNPTMH
jgi:hypothetical protein